jgi:hypothetical protein
VTSYYIREIKNLFVTGQTIPSMQVPGPHARKVSATAKLRTHYIAYKLLQKAKSNRMKLSKLMKFFPDTHELQMRQRLKVRLRSFLLPSSLSLLAAGAVREAYWIS